MQARTIETSKDIAEGLTALVQLDARLAEVVERAGPVPLRRRTPGFEGLAQIIVSQMVSKAAAAAFWQRLVEEAGGCRPARVARLSDAQCRRIGLSRSRERTLKGAAEAVLSGRFDPQALCLMSADAAIASMTALKGIGVWTAEVYLLFCAGHRDVFPAGDLALRKAAGHALGLEGPPDEKTLRGIARRWRPWRSVAARLFWAYYSSNLRDPAPRHSR
ncbi:DNA-3-methyladenine glycosylase family protein [Candidatus Palauibacter sp.]|uniref:DNA-3-methyladenine glycosylase family protein n=1 Tax=Candidatus Palauibacter sp. TaxID=3101350 RepID=UPI003B02139E